MWFNRDYAENQYPTIRNRSELLTTRQPKWFLQALMLLLLSITLLAQSPRNPSSSPDSRCSEWVSAGIIEKWLAKWPIPDVYPYEIRGQKRNSVENEYRLCFRPQPESEKKFVAEVHFGMPETMYQEFDRILTSKSFGYTRTPPTKFLGLDPKTYEEIYYYNVVWTKSVVTAEGSVANTSLSKLKGMQATPSPVVAQDKSPSSQSGTVGSGNATGRTNQPLDKIRCEDKKGGQILLDLSLRHFISYLDYRSEQARLSLEDPNYKPRRYLDYLKKEVPEIYQQVITALERRCPSSPSERSQREK